MKVQLMLDGQMAAEIDLNDGERVIGSATPSNILLEDPSVSPTHAKIYEENGQALIVDMGSQSGTLVEGIRINAPAALTDGVSVRLGDFDFQLKIVADAQPPVATTVPGSNAHTPPIPPIESPAGAKQASCARGLGKGLMDLAKASAREAGRGAQMAGLKAQAEKAKRIDLPGALSALGSKAFELRALPDVCGSLYEEIAAIDEAIKTKRAGVVAGQDAGFAEKAKAMAVSLKQKTEAEALGMKRKSKCVEVGRLLVGQNPAIEELRPLIQAVLGIQGQIDELDKQFGTVADDRAGRNAFMASARDIGANAQTASKSPVWKKPLVWAGLAGVLAILFIVLVPKSPRSVEHVDTSVPGAAATLPDTDESDTTPSLEGTATVQDARNWLDESLRGSANRRSIPAVFLYPIADYEIISIEKEVPNASELEIGNTSVFTAEIRLQGVGLNGFGTGWRRELVYVAKGPGKPWIMYGVR